MATNFSLVEYIGDGITQQFAVNFPSGYISRLDVFVSVDGVATPFTWISDGLISVSPAPADLTTVRVYRSTDISSNINNYEDGSTIIEKNLDDSFSQTVLAVQEISDTVNNNSMIVDSADGKWGADSRIIKNITPGVSATDAVTVGQIEPFVASATASAATATTQAGLSNDARVLSETAQGLSETAQGLSEDARDLSQAYAASVDPTTTVHSPGSGLDNEAGTAYASDVTTSSTDTTAGRLLKVGDFGVGGSSVTLPSNSNPDTIGSNGKYYCSLWLGGTTPYSFGHLEHQEVDSLYSIQKFYGATAAAESVWVRVEDAGVWQPWRKVYTQASILGTVSQTAGVPTGAIIERGSNANGEYVKYADGTLICTGFINTGVGSVSSGAVYISPASTWTYPAAFVTTAPTLSFNAIQLVVGGTNPIGVSRPTSGAHLLTSAPNIHVWYSGVSAVVVTRMSCIAIGRWF